MVVEIVRLAVYSVPDRLDAAIQRIDPSELAGSGLDELLEVG